MFEKKGKVRQNPSVQASIISFVCILMTSDYLTYKDIQVAVSTLASPCVL